MPPFIHFDYLYIITRNTELLQQKVNTTVKKYFHEWLLQHVLDLVFDQNCFVRPLMIRKFSMLRMIR